MGKARWHSPRRRADKKRHCAGGAHACAARLANFSSASICGVESQTCADTRGLVVDQVYIKRRYIHCRGNRGVDGTCFLNILVPQSTVTRKSAGGNHTVSFGSRMYRADADITEFPIDWILHCRSSSHDHKAKNRHASCDT